MSEVSALLKSAAQRLKAAGINTAMLDARHLLTFVLGRRLAELGPSSSIEVDAEHQARFETLLSRRIAREPLQRLIGHWGFWSLELEMGEAGLIPRPDSETLIEAVLHHFPDRDRPLRVLDLGTGTGCLLLATLSEYPKASGLGIDISPDAVELAGANARLTGLEERAAFQTGNWGGGLAERFDLVISNPPYIPSADIAELEPEVRRFEPMAALDGGADGLDAYRDIARELPRLLVPEGLAVLELGEGQEDGVAALLRAAGLAVLGSRADAGGIARALLARFRK